VTYTGRLAGEEGFLRKNKDELHSKLPALMAHSAWPFVRDLFLAREADARRQEVARQFCSSMRGLSATLEATEQHFIRCVKPNGRKEAFGFDEGMVKGQLLSCGVLAAAKVAQVTNRGV
jgi:myosin heavy subunit